MPAPHHASRYTAQIDSPLGPLAARASEKGITELRFGALASEPLPGGVLGQLADELRAYFAGSLRVFRVPLDARGTEFEQRVWGELLRLPWGTTTSYGQIAHRLGMPGASRAVGRANGSNPVAIVIPCHRVIASTGKLHGYAGGLDNKRALLELEHASLFAH